MTTTPETHSLERRADSPLPSIFPRLTIERKKNQPGASRRFSVQLAGFLTADHLWEPPSSSGTYPVWLAYLGTASASQAFTANLRAGYRAAGGTGVPIRIPKQSGHRWTTQTLPSGGADAVLTVAYLPDLFHLEPLSPRSDDELTQFAFAPPRWWIEAQTEQLGPDFGDDAEEAAEAALFVAYLDRRTHLPIVADLRFHLALYRAAQGTSWVGRPTGLHDRFDSDSFERGMTALGFGRVLVVHALPTTIASFLCEQTALHQEELRHGTTSRTPDRRLLPFPQGPATQLCLDFEAA